MRDEDGGDLLLGRKLKDLVLQHLPGHGVQRTEWLIHQQQLGILCEAACDLHPLLHATRELPRKLIPRWAQAHLRDQCVDDGVLLLGRDIARFQAEGHVAAYGPPWQQRL